MDILKHVEKAIDRAPAEKAYNDEIFYKAYWAKSFNHAAWHLVTEEKRTSSIAEENNCIRIKYDGHYWYACGKQFSHEPVNPDHIFKIIRRYYRPVGELCYDIWTKPRKWDYRKEGPPTGYVCPECFVIYLAWTIDLYNRFEAARERSEAEKDR